MGDFINLYQGKALPPVKVQYVDYVEWRKDRIETDKTLEQKRYWEEKFKHGIPKLNIPTDFERPPTPMIDTKVLRNYITGEPVQRITEAVKEHSVSMGALIMTGYALILSRFCQQKDLVIGLLNAARNHPDLEGVVGYINNLLPIVINIQDEDTLLDVLKMVGKTINEAITYQDYAFDDVEGLSNDTLLNFHNEVDDQFELAIEGLEFSEYDHQKIETEMDVAIDVIVTPTDIFVKWKYNSLLLKEETIQKLWNDLVSFADELLKDPYQKISDLSL
jgi:phthiocerol/phenolphthiocerol synthesis type-I polyketide synthase E